MKILRLAVGAWCLVLAGAARADMTAMDLQIAARALSFMEQPLSGRLQAGIVYSSGDQRSVRQADALERLIGRGMRIGNIELRAVRVDGDQAASADVDLFLLVENAGEAAAAAGAASAHKKVPCITTDLPQVRAGLCVMGVRTTPKVEILVNRAAAEASDTAFATVFRMMVTEL